MDYSVSMEDARKRIEENEYSPCKRYSRVFPCCQSRPPQTPHVYKVPLFY
ncbi:hypothetical protein WN55_11152 [Dufourea novaeangliae]|uniref:Uncharacterized protein n=1 Tax=Dufourea novaeangliae TaxID=178035 RepID=A0A154PBW5_DUFNO|nr:hypothetical protein WN55_11152 [Dufourea novaeangliae]